MTWSEFATRVYNAIQYLLPIMPERTTQEVEEEMTVYSFASAENRMKSMLYLNVGRIMNADRTSQLKTKMSYGNFFLLSTSEIRIWNTFAVMKEEMVTNMYKAIDPENEESPFVYRNFSSVRKHCSPRPSGNNRLTMQHLPNPLVGWRTGIEIPPKPTSNHYLSL